LLHCGSLKEAESVLIKLKQRITECGLELNPDKTHIVYCKHGRRHLKYKRTSFTFLGFDFCQRVSRNRKGERYLNFSAGVSRVALKDMKNQVRRWNIPFKNSWSIDELARYINTVTRGWYKYYGKFYKTAMKWLWRNINHYLCRWVMRKYKRYQRYKAQAYNYLVRIAKEKPKLFFHWHIGYAPNL